MEIKVTSKNGHLSEDVQATIRQKVARLPRFFDRTTGIQVIADLRRNESPNVEIIVSAEETNDFFAADTGSNVIAALDSVINKLESQLRKHKEKLTGHRHRDHKQMDASPD